MKKLCYKSEVGLNWFGVFFVFFIIGIALHIAINERVELVRFVQDLSNNLISSSELLDIIKPYITGLILVEVIFALPFMIITFLLNKKERQMIKRLKEHGKTTNGKIIGWYKSPLGTDDIKYSLLIEYENESGTKKFRTPALNFDPKWSLGSTDCTIYYDNEDSYATNFVEARVDTERVFADVPYIKDF